MRYVMIVCYGLVFFSVLLAQGVIHSTRSSKRSGLRRPVIIGENGHYVF